MRHHRRPNVPLFIRRRLQRFQRYSTSNAQDHQDTGVNSDQTASYCDAVRSHRKMPHNEGKSFPHEACSYVIVFRRPLRQLLTRLRLDRWRYDASHIHARSNTGCN